MDREKLRDRLNLINNEIEIYKTNVIEHVKKEEMVPATCDLLIMRDLKEQQLLLKNLLESEDKQ